MNRQQQLVTILLGFLVPAAILGSRSGRAAEGKPSDEEVERAGEAVRQQFKSDYESRNPAVRASLVERLLGRADQIDTKPAEKYFLLANASQIAAQIGDAAKSSDAAEKLEQAFDVDVFELRWANLKALAGSIKKDGKSEGALVNVYEDLAGEGWLRRGVRESLQMNAAVATVTRRTRSSFLAGRIDAWKRRTRARRREIDEAHEEWKRHCEAPADPSVAAAVGAFRCYVLDDWDRGLPDLARSLDADLVQVAEKDLAAPETPEARLSLALDWDRRAQIQKGFPATEIFARACHWYRKARSGLGQDEIQGLDERFGVPPARIHLADLEPFGVVVGWGEYCNDGRLHTEGPMTIHGYHDRRGILLHPGDGKESRVMFRLQGRFRTFSTWIGLPDRGALFKGILRFSVHGDGRELWRSKPVSKALNLQSCTVSVKGVEVLELRVDCPGDNTHAMASWVDAWLSSR